MLLRARFATQLKWQDGIGLCVLCEVLLGIMACGKNVLQNRWYLYLSEVVHLSLAFGEARCSMVPVG